MVKKIGIIGGGISGLVAAFLLKKKGFTVTLFEKSGRLGGNVQTVRVDDFLLEYAPNSLLKSPRLVDLIRKLNLETEVLAANPANKKRFVLQNGRLKALPLTTAKMAIDNYFSLRARLRLVREPFVRTKSPENESVAEFFARRFGREIVEKAVDPFISGIYAGNPENLSVKTAFPRLYKLEKDFGSLFFGALFSKTEKAEKNFPRTFSFADGAQTLTDKLAENLGENVKTDTEVFRLAKFSGEKWLVETNLGEQIFDALIISTPAEAAANLIENLDANLSEQLRSIYYPPVALIFFGVKKENIGQNLDGFGFLIPGSEKRKILGTIWNSAVFESRAPEGYHLLTSFVGGARNAEICSKSDDELFEVVFQELKDILDLREAPDFRHIKRWRKAIPQYEIGYEKTENAVEEFERKYKNIFFCSSFYKGISVGDCVKNAYRAAGEIEEFLSRK